MTNPRVDVEISLSKSGLGILYKTLLARKLSKPEDGRYRPKHVVFSIANKQHHLVIYLYLCFCLKLPRHIV